jgi:Iguana/Dzip1-like DAZ-interacting protein N-terminal
MQPSTGIDDGKFKFAEKRGTLDWKSLEATNLDLIQHAPLDNIHLLERLMQNLTFAQVEKADLKRIKDKNALKMFKLGQLSTEYLLYTSGIAETIAQQRQREYESSYIEAAKL